VLPLFAAMTRRSELQSLGLLDSAFVDISEHESLNAAMSLLRIPDSICIGVTDVAAASSWYTEKLGVQQDLVSTGDAGECVSLGLSTRDEAAIVLGPRDTTPEERPILYTSNIEKARDLLTSRGVSVSPIEEDQQGTHYFIMRDLEGNEIEVTEEP
jgi:catechol 2,3-dioxygenase-like lactoylglutathione lyase family enzyme